MRRSKPAAATELGEPHPRGQHGGRGVPDGDGRRYAGSAITSPSKAWHTAAAVLRGADIALEIVVFDRDGVLVGKTDFRPSHEASRPLKRR